MKTFAKLSIRISHGVFAMGVQSTPGGFRKTKSEKRDDLGSRRRKSRYGSTKADLEANEKIKLEIRSAKVKNS